MKRLAALLVAAALAALPRVGAARPAAKVTHAQRLAAIRIAKVWTPTAIAQMDLRAGPPGRDAFAPGSLVTCDYLVVPRSGHTRKFTCDLGDNDPVKVRYGADNGEVQGSVLASRLLWALGFGADRVYPVRVVCRGCSADPWNDRAPAAGAHTFDPAAIDLNPSGKTIETSDRSGWAWSDLELIDDSRGASVAERDALTLLAVFMQHGDNKAGQQRLVCLPGAMRGDVCEAPFMLMRDVGNTFGRANTFNRDMIGAVNFDAWSRTPIWRDRGRCRGHLGMTTTGTLDDPLIGEAGRQFLATLLQQLTDRQIHDLFEVAGVDRRSRRPGSAAPPASIDEWVAAFKNKRAQIVDARCPF